ncbi:MAG: PIN domain-containing protein [Candidatus Melainabacteria bacterium]|nr:PIN domain-containing protein [Candidatus Melainabacteria bacterium]
MLYLLDTDICSYIMKRSHLLLLEKLRSVELESIAVSVITEAELLYGIKSCSKPKLARAAFDGFIRHVQVLDWSRDAAEHYADIRANLHKRCQLIGANDLMIAAHSRSLGATIVTNNVREFRRVQRLTVQNWAQ